MVRAVLPSGAVLDGSHLVPLVETCCSEGKNSTSDGVLQSLDQAGSQAVPPQTHGGMNLAL
jgi:hypothetical protein